MYPNTALDKSPKTADYYSELAQPDNNALYHNTATRVYVTQLWNIRHSAKTNCVLWKEDSTQIEEFTQFPDFTKTPIAKTIIF